LGRPWAWRRDGRRDGDLISRLIVLLGGMAGAVMLLLIWSSALGVIADDRASRELAAQSRAMAAARAVRDALPRALEPAERAIAALQNRAGAQGRGAWREAEAIEKHLLAAVLQGQDGLRAVAASDASGALIWQPQPGALPAWLGGSAFFLAHRQGRMAALLSPLGGGGLVLSAPILGPAGAQGRGGFAGVALALIDQQRLAQALPGGNAPGEPQLLLFHGDGSLLAGGRHAVSGHGALRLEQSLAPDPLPGGHAERSVTRHGGEAGRSMAVASVQVPGFELVVQSSLEDGAGGDAAHRLALLVYGLAGAISCLVVMGLIWLFGREEARAAGVASPPPMPPGPPGFTEALPGVAYAARVTLAPNGVGWQVSITAVNAAMLQVTGWESAAFQDVARWQRAIDWASYPAGGPLLERLAAMPALDEGQVEYRLRRADGGWMWLRESAKVVGRGPHHVDVLGWLADVTGEREAAAPADDAGRIAAQGVMAAGLAHELNQPLAVMALAAENALEALQEGEAGIPEALLRLRRIAAQAERAKAVAAQLRSFGRLEAAVLEPVCLAAAVRGALGVVGGALAEAGVEVALRMAPNLAAVRGQAVLVEQVVVNLAQNARDAMAACPQGQRRLSIIGEPGLEAHEVRLVLRDTGGGVPAEALGRVFDPFFSTKPASQGMGLGLALCRSIMLGFGGSIGLRNLADGRGAEAVLVFQRARQGPAATGSALDIEPAPPAPEGTQRGRARRGAK